MKRLKLEIENARLEATIAALRKAQKDLRFEIANIDFQKERDHWEEAGSQEIAINNLLLQLEAKKWDWIPLSDEYHMSNKPLKDLKDLREDDQLPSYLPHQDTIAWYAVQFKPDIRDVGGMSDNREYDFWVGESDNFYHLFFLNSHDDGPDYEYRRRDPEESIVAFTRGILVEYEIIDPTEEGQE